MNLTPSHVIATTLATEHRVIKSRAESHLKALESLGLLVRTDSRHGSTWATAKDLPGLPSGVVAQHDTYLNQRSASYQTLLLCPLMVMMLGASTRKDAGALKVFKLAL
ncbi:hypothetical protein ACNFIC_00710 [Pseudomonas sp. NY15463]|uniref:hypothetical protein n=1 Tax=Pseudomonas sp. NY15463 TaxID=3400361 RepID=UPI003A8A6973